MNPFLQNLEHLGYTAVKDKTSRLWPVLERNGSKIMLPPNPLPSGDWLYIDLTDRSAHRIESLLGLPFAKNTPQSYTLPPPDVDWFDVVKKTKEKWNSIHHTSFSFLRERGIDPALVRPLLGGLKGDYNKLFLPLYLEVEGEGRFVGVSTRFSKKSRVLAGQKRIFGKRGVGFFGKKEADMYVFESEIDAFSHYQICKEKDPIFEAFYVITCGALSTRQLQTIVFAREKNGNKKVYACFDADVAGKDMYVKLAQKINCERLLPPQAQGKDWNEFVLQKTI